MLHTIIKRRKNLKHLFFAAQQVDWCDLGLISEFCCLAFV